MKRLYYTLGMSMLVLLALAQFTKPAPPVISTALASSPPSIALEQIANMRSVGGSNPVAIVDAGDGSGRLFIVEQPGRIMIYDGAQLHLTPFLDIHTIVSLGGEQGLLGLAFDPSFATNHYFYVNYTGKSGIGDTVIARYQVSASNPNIANTASATTLLTIVQPQTNHNGGALQFGPDGYLYISSGDGGNGGDEGPGHNPMIGNAQDLNSLLGKILRIDVRNINISDGLPYDIPPGNPFVNDNNSETRAEIWAYGLRNPWRFSFDRQTGDMFIGDVGQGSREEIDFQPPGAGGQNYGWRRMEGSLCYNPAADCQTDALVMPILEYHNPHYLNAVVGGYRYRGSRFPELLGTYFYADYGSGQIWGATQNGTSWTATELLGASDVRVSTFGEDQDGELYLADHYSGRIYRITTAAASKANLRPLFLGRLTGDATTSPGEADALFTTLARDAITSIDIAMGGFNRASVRDALLDADDRGVQVRVIGDDEDVANPLYAPSYDALRASGIRIISDTQNSLMHNTFAVFDSYVTWTGSANFTDTGFTFNGENVLVITDTVVAGIYATEFAEMGGGAFSNDKTDNTAHNATVSGRPIEIAFAPTDGVESRIVGAITTANTSVQVAMSAFTDDALGDTLIAAYTRGVTVELILDQGAAGEAGSQRDRLCAAGVTVRVENVAAQLHDNYVIVDAGTTSDPLIITGSASWTAAAMQANDENVLIVHDSDLASAYAADLARIRAAITPGGFVCNAGAAQPPITVLYLPLVFYTDEGAARTATTLRDALYILPPHRYPPYAMLP
jgi:glucose/arabinose dehydrogenase